MTFQENRESDWQPDSEPLLPPPPDSKLGWKQEKIQVVAERRNFLDRVMGMPEEAPLPADEQEQHRQDFHKLLTTWEEQWSDDYGDLITELHETGSIFPLIQEAYASGNLARDVNFSMLQGLASKIIEESRNRPGTFDEHDTKRQKWMALEESDKRAVRLAEMIILLTDVIKATADKKAGRALPSSLEALAKVATQYSQRNQDVPDSFKGFLYDWAVAIRKDLRNAKSSPSAPPKFQGKAPQFVGNAPQPMPTTPRPQPESYQQPAEDNGNVIDLVKGPDGTWAPAAGEPPADLPPAPGRLTYEPPVVPPDAGGSAPPSGADTAPSE